MVIGATLLLIGTYSVAEDLEIKLTDESDKSTLKQGKIVGCNDYVEKEELSCSKQPEEMILSKLPTSIQLDAQDKDADLKEIKTQLSSILKELSELKKEREADKEIKKQLADLIKIISSKKAVSAEKKLNVVQTGIKKLIRENTGKKSTKTFISKKIKVIESYTDHVIIEVQEGESLSTYAQAYYNNNRKYYRIYKANKDKISSNLEVVIGTHLTIPLGN